MDLDPTVGNRDTLELGAGISPATVTVSRAGNDLLLHLSGTLDQLTLQSFLVDPAYRIELVRFANGTTWDSETLSDQAREPLSGTAGNDFLQPVNVVGGPVDHLLSGGTGDDFLNGDTDDDVRFVGQDKLVGGGGNDRLMGGALEDLLYGGIGDDQLYGDGYFSPFVLNNAQSSIHPGADVLLGESGDDFLDGGGGNDELDGGPDDDALFGNVGDDQLDGGDGGDILVGGVGHDRLVGGQGDDALYGDGQQFGVGGGDDILDGGVGNDFLSGGEGSDTYIFGRGYGQDTIVNVDAEFGHVDRIKLKPDIFSSDMVVTRSVDPSRPELGQADLILNIKGTTDQLTVRGFFIDASNQVQQVTFDDGTLWDAQTLLSETAAIEGTAGPDVLKSTGLLFNETLIGFDGDDVLDGGAGADLLIGGPGDDTYVVDTTVDEIVERAGGGMDTVQSLMNYTLTDETENLTLLNPIGNSVNLGNGWFGPDPERAAIYGIGNDENNFLTGNQADNIMDGGA
jgi:Ca2+-binding RTX toxin-like protein